MATTPTPRHRILLVREWDAQTSGSGCCGGGGLGGDLFARPGEVVPGPRPAACDRPGDPDAFPASRSLMEHMGGIYRALRRELPREVVDITVVDPRNTVWLVPTMLRDGRRRGLRGRRLWRELHHGVRNGAIVVDGRALSAHDYPAPDDAVDAVLHELARSGRAVG